MRDKESDDRATAYPWGPTYEPAKRPNDPAPGPWIITEQGHVYSQPLYVPAPFTDPKGVRHEDYMAGLVALVYGGPETTALVAEAPTLKEQRDELLAALEAALATAGVRSELTRRIYGHPVNESWVPAARAVAAKARKGRT